MLRIAGTLGCSAHLASAIAAGVIRAGARGRYFNTVDLVTQLEEETSVIITTNLTFSANGPACSATPR